MRKILSFFALLGIVALFQSCAIKPSSFVRSSVSSQRDGGSWTAILIRDDLSYDKAFNEVLDVCARRFEMDVISKDGGYGRSNWIYTWNDKGTYYDKYRTRIVFKFSADRTKVEIKTDAEFGGEDRWQTGWDTRLLQTLKQDIMGVVGRVTF
ncbi:MAG: hypothetical protein LBE91_14890 [Tannerella sp.]|jgi:hypothetical protein|nr:hypothetical protein [Tannerella sp.]